MVQNKIVAALGFLACSLVSNATLAQAVKVDPALPTYEKASGVSGNFTSVGSDTLNNLMTLWAETYKRNYPNVNIQIQGAGSSTAPPALIQGAANFGPMSRTMKDERNRGLREEAWLQAHRRAASRSTPWPCTSTRTTRSRACPSSRSTPSCRRPQMRRRRGHHQVGPGGHDRRLGRSPHRPVRPQLGVRHLRLLQGKGAVQG